MRSTLLVRMAAAGAVMDELCLRTETFEQVSMVYGSPGELVVCAPQVSEITKSQGGAGQRSLNDSRSHSLFSVDPTLVLYGFPQVVRFYFGSLQFLKASSLWLFSVGFLLVLVNF